MKNNSGWCRFSPCENFKMCVKTKPPLVIFTVGIFVLALAFIALAVYIQEADEIPNPNFVTDWDDFLMDMSRFEWSNICSKEEKSKCEEPRGNATEEISVVISMKLSNFPVKPVNRLYRSNIKGKDLIKDKLPKYMEEDVLTLTFSSFNVSSEHTASVCLTVLSNETFLSPQLKKPTLCSPPKTDDLLVKEVKACKKAADKVPAFSVNHKADPLLKMYLTVDDRLNIHMHLMSTSYFLFVVALTVLLYSIVKRRAISTGSESHNSLLHNANNSDSVVMSKL